MRMIHWGVSRQTAENGQPLTCHCHILVRDVPPPMNGESYGIRLTVAETEEMMEFMDLTVSGKRILDLAEALVRCGVTPCTLRDVVSDWL